MILGLTTTNFLLCCILAVQIISLYTVARMYEDYMKGQMMDTCKRDGCVPVKVTPSGEVFCQNCVRPMTDREHVEYFKDYDNRHPEVKKLADAMRRKVER